MKAKLKREALRRAQYRDWRRRFRDGLWRRLADPYWYTSKEIKHWTAHYTCFEAQLKLGIEPWWPHEVIRPNVDWDDWMARQHQEEAAR